MITFKEWQDRFFPEMPALMTRWKNSGYSREELAKITHELVPDYATNKSVLSPNLNTDSAEKP